MTKTIISFVCLLLAATFVDAQSNAYKDKRLTYLWDVTLSMKGYNGSPDIYDEVVKAMVRDIESETNDKTEIVVVPFQDSRYCEVWREYATPEGIGNLKAKIKAYKNEKITKTNISAPLQYAIDEIFTTDKIDIMKLMTDGADNVDPARLSYILEHWCQIAKSKDVYGYYILLTEAAKGNDDLIFQLEEICNFEVIEVENGDMSAINEIRQLNVKQSDERIGLSINIRDEYNVAKTLRFTSHGSNWAPGYKIHVKTSDNPYLDVDEVVEVKSDLSAEIHPKFKLSKSGMMAQEWEEYDDIVLEMTPIQGEGAHKYTRLLDQYTRVKLINKPEKTVSFYVQ